MSQDVSQRRGLFGSTVKGITKVGGGHDKNVDTRPPSQQQSQHQPQCGHK
jgi:hypothetical protein